MRTIRLALMPIALFCGAVLTQGCSSQDKPVSDTTSASAIQQSDKLTSTTHLRDAQTGELSRTERRDNNGTLRELEIKYTDGRTGTRYLDASGKATNVTLVTSAGDIVEGQCSADGKNIAEWTKRNKAGQLLAYYHHVNGEPEEVARSYNNGVLVWEYLWKPGPLVRVYHEDGKTVALEANCNSPRQWLKMYGSDGTLRYSEVVSDPKARYGDVITYHGTVYSAAGKAVQRLISTEGPYSNWDSGIHTVEELAEDGSVKSSADSKNDSNYPYKPLDPVHRHISDAKQNAYKFKNDGKLRMHVLDDDLHDVLND